ncbi:hypothetical protein HY988_01950 [Candidatus Micrarchaeota archaeon]|nr:hypothetical protein [Candidatus Micrarchaeota archaeon]
MLCDRRIDVVACYDRHYAFGTIGMRDVRLRGFESVDTTEPSPQVSMVR